jgi:hypothetical protein
MEELNCDVDATIFKKLRSYRIGMCIQNERGEFVEANISPQEAEAEYDTIIKKSKALLCNLQNFMLILFGDKRKLLLTPLNLHYIIIM